jgi:4-amino-4-deoxy-L-arabinose transferase-like glycosyltransferase
MLSLPPMRARGVVEGLVVVSVALVATVVMTYPLAFGLGSLGRVDTSDGQFSIWNVAWVAHALLTDPGHVWNANIFHPHTGTLAYAEANLVSGGLAVPAYWLTGNPHAAHNSAVLLSFVLSAVGMYYLARYLTGSRPGAAVAAVLFAFCPFIWARTAHIQLLMTGGLPFSLLAAHRVIDRPEPGRAVVLGLTLVITALACGYYGVFAGLAVGLASLFYLVARRHWKNGAFYVALACAAAVAILAIWPIYQRYLGLQSESQPFRELEEARGYAANWAAYLAADGFGNGWVKIAALKATGVRWQEVLFPGLATFVLAAVGVGAAAAATPVSGSGGTSVRTRETAAFYGLVAALAAWLSFGPDAGLYSLMYRYVPAFTLLRAPARFGIVVTLALAVLAALGTAHLLRARRHAAAMAAAVCVVAAAELISAPLPLRAVPPTPAPYALLAHLPPGAVAEFPFFYREIDFHRHASYMLNSTAHWKPLVNGYSDYLPVDFRAMVIPVSSFPVLEAFNLLHKHGTRYVVFHANWYDHRSLEKLQARIRQYSPYLRKLATEGDISLYEIVGWPDREPF